MNPDRLSELLSAYIDGEVDERERALIERILREDASARRLLDQLRRTIQVVSSLPRHGAPPTLATDLEAQLERTELLGGAEPGAAYASEQRPPWTAWFAIAAMLGVVVVSGWWFLQDRRPNGPGSPESTVASRDERQPSSAAIPSPNPAGTLSGGDAAPMRHVAGPTMESQLAAGVEPSLLMKQSFAPEEVRLQVVAATERERDQFAASLAKRFARQDAEDLASRTRSRLAGKSIGSFFLVGKPGVNFDDPQQRQVLIRIPRSQAAQVVDDLASIVGSQDRVALQAGPVAVRGASKARSLIQLVGNLSPQDQTANAEGTRSPNGESKSELLDERVGPTNKPGESPKQLADWEHFDPLGGLLKIVGIDEDLVAGGRSDSGTSSQSEPSPKGLGPRSSDRVAMAGKAGEAPSSAEGPAATGDEADSLPPSSPAPAPDRIASNEGAEVPFRETFLADKKGEDSTPDATKRETRSLVRRRQIAAKNAVAKVKETDDKSLGESRDLVALRERERTDRNSMERKIASSSNGGETNTAADDFVTIVIEFVVPTPPKVPLPPVKKPTNGVPTKS